VIERLLIGPPPSELADAAHATTPVD
jgi:hypothetical protein